MSLSCSFSITIYRPTDSLKTFIDSLGRLEGPFSLTIDHNADSSRVEYESPAAINHAPVISNICEIISLIQPKGIFIFIDTLGQNSVFTVFLDGAVFRRWDESEVFDNSSKVLDKIVNSLLDATVNDGSRNPK